MTETLSYAKPGPDDERAGGDLVAKPSRSYRVKWTLMGLLLIGGGAWFLWDGYVGYPEHNRQNQATRARGETPKEADHSDTDIMLQRLIGYGLPPLGLFVLFWGLYSSRGEYRLVGSTLHVPGHPPVPLDNIREIDKTQWDRKGIAALRYEVPGSPSAATARLKLDDYLYDRDPTDRILERIEAAVVPGE